MLFKNTLVNTNKIEHSIEIEDISNLSDDKKKYIFGFIDMCLRDYKTQKAYK